MKTKKASSTGAAIFRPTHTQITQRAHELWEQAGRPENRDLEHWLEAERQLGRDPVLHDDATRLTASPNDPASSDAAEVDEEISHMAERPKRRSVTSTL